MPNKDDNNTELETTEAMAEPEATVVEQTEGASQETTESATEKPVPEAKEEVDETISNLIAELAKAKKQADLAQDQALRAQAELQNFRRRKEREAGERIAQGNAKLLREVLPAIDDFERAFDNIPNDISAENTAWADGFQLILRKLQMVLEREGVTGIDATGEFDPNWHEAISVEANDEIASDHIIAEVQKGYKLNDKILRPSYVRVAQ